MLSFSLQAQHVKVSVDSISITGNNKTNDHIILREILFSVGDSVAISRLPGMLDTSIMNVLNTRLFVEVYVNFQPLNRNSIIITVDVKERWYVYPQFSLSLADRNFNVWWYEKDHKLNRLEYGVGMVAFNLTGNNDPLRLNFVFGFANKFAASYDLPFFNEKTKLGGGASFAYQTNRQVYYTTKENAQVFFESDENVRKKIKADINLHTRNNIFYTTGIKLQFNHVEITDSIAHLNPDYLGGGRKILDFPVVSLHFADNHTDNHQYPLQGHYFEAEINKIGFGSPVNQVSIALQANGYKPLSSKFFIASMLATKMNFSKDYPYYLLESLGYCEFFVRGYEYYVVDGQHTFLLRNNIKWKFIDWKVKPPIIQSDKIEEIPVQVYLKLFADAGYVIDNYYNGENPLSNSFLYSAGLGIDITSSYNWVFRLESAVNAMGELGVFLHLGLDLTTYEACSIW
ncbi:MAG: hypothetical protein KA954_01100 [Chitinophagales bacterium]|nr:hypothetical protein [Chitinophagales bacterium]MBP9548458.1 hypothetical protein [Chitinophagales bacterium]